MCVKLRSIRCVAKIVSCNAGGVIPDVISVATVVCGFLLAGIPICGSYRKGVSGCVKLESIACVDKLT
jgi:hypothetical protein